VPDKHVLLADMRLGNANAAAEVLRNAGYEVSVATVDASSLDAVHATGPSWSRLASWRLWDARSVANQRSLPIRNSLQ
jgi:hypothetical protein